MYGIKLGHYLKSTPWLGIELESFITTPQRSQQRLTLGVPGLGAFQYDEGGATNRLIVASPSLLARYQAGAFKPYVGIGPGIIFLHQQLLISMAGGCSYSHQTQGWAQYSGRTSLSSHRPCRAIRRVEVQLRAR